MVLVDCIGQLHGYSEGELLTTLNSEKISNYSVENEGFESEKLSDKNYQVKVDISKKIPLIDVSNVYIEISDLQDSKNYISGNGSVQKSKGNILFHKRSSDGKEILNIAEKENLTQNSYKSILSIIKVMFDSNEAVEYFKLNYPEMSITDKEFKGFKIEINPTKTEFEEGIISEHRGYKFVRITINKDEALKAFGNLDSITQTTNNENKTVLSNNQNKVANIAVMPRTGKQQNLNLIIAYILIFLAISGIFSLIITRKNK